MWGQESSNLVLKVFFLALISRVGGGGGDFSHRILFERSIWRSKVKLSKNLVKG